MWVSWWMTWSLGRFFSGFLPFSVFIISYQRRIITRYWVHHCGPGASMHACHAVGPGSIPVRTSFLGEVFLGFSLTCKTNVRSSNIIWSLLSSCNYLIIKLHYPQCAEGCASYIFIYVSFDRCRAESHSNATI